MNEDGDALGYNGVLKRCEITMEELPAPCCETGRMTAGSHRELRGTQDRHRTSGALNRLESGYSLRVGDPESKEELELSLIKSGIRKKTSCVSYASMEVHIIGIHSKSWRPWRPVSANFFHFPPKFRLRT